MPKRVRWLLLFVLVAGGAGLLFFVKMYRDDVKALKNFFVAYDRFDTSMAGSALSPPAEDTADTRAALAELRDRSDLRLSSLIRNDGELIALALEIAGLAEREFRGPAGLPGEERTALTKKRKAAFARFLELASVKGRDA